LRIAVNALALGPGQTGIGAYTEALMHATLGGGGGHEFVFLTAPNFTRLSLDNNPNARRLTLSFTCGLPEPS